MTELFPPMTSQDMPRLRRQAAHSRYRGRPKGKPAAKEEDPQPARKKKKLAKSASLPPVPPAPTTVQLQLHLSNAQVTKKRGRGRPKVYDDFGNRLDGQPRDEKKCAAAMKARAHKAMVQDEVARRMKLQEQEWQAKKVGLTAEQVDLELPYRGLFTFEEADTVGTQPDDKFRRLFEELGRLSEAERIRHGDKTLVKKPTAEERQAETQWEEQTLTVSKTRCVHFAEYEIDTWFKSPYPAELATNYVLHVCQHCLQYFGSAFSLHRHILKCPYFHHPPGREIYRDSTLSLFEVDGRKNIVYCQNLCLFAKMFLDSKTLYYDVEPFMFYVLCEFDRAGNTHRFVGYFSKEKLNGSNYNLSCIMTLPVYQRKGYGSFLIDFSYLLCRREFKLGTPEKPLSDLGLLSYRNYWKLAVAKALSKVDGSCVAIDDLSNMTGMIHNDVVVGLEQLNALVYDDATKRYGIVIDRPLVEAIISKWKAKGYVEIDPSRLVWKPVILGPSGGINTTTKMVITGQQSADGSFSEDENEAASTVTAAASLNGQKYDEKGNKLMSDISLICNFLKDDLEDDRDLEAQALERIRESKAVQEFDFERSRVCFPGMKRGEASVAEDANVAETLEIEEEAGVASEDEAEPEAGTSEPEYEQQEEEEEQESDEPGEESEPEPPSESGSESEEMVEEEEIGEGDYDE